MKAAAIGTFDGVHSGHKAVLKRLTEYAGERDLQPVAVTFNNHPLSHIAPEKTPAALTPVWKKKKLLAEAGVTPVCFDFNEELRQTSARDMMKRLRDEFEIKALIVGYDNTFGNDGVNLSLNDYKDIGEELGIDVVSVEEVPGVSSSKIRKAVAAGDVEKAREMLGRPYSITSKVVKGNSLGHTIGFPTANISLPEGIAIPKSGVYAAIVKNLSDGTKHPAMVNIGSRPTVMRGDEVVLEAHLIDWTGDLYDKDITVRFIERIRDEKKFESIDALKHQLEEDRKDALDILKN